MKILTIEDSEFERKLIVNILHKTGYTDVIEAENGEDGLRKFQEEKPDLVLLDIRMPGISGMDVLKKIEPRKSNTKVIVFIISIVRKQDTIDESIKLGASAYIMKPIDKDKLIEAIKKSFG